MQDNDVCMLCVSPAPVIKVAPMHLSFAASRWLRSDGQYVKSMGWGEFFQLVLEHFGKDQHELLITHCIH